MNTIDAFDLDNIWCAYWRGGPFPVTEEEECLEFIEGGLLRNAMFRLGHPMLEIAPEIFVLRMPNGSTVRIGCSEDGFYSRAADVGWAAWDAKDDASADVLAEGVGPESLLAYLATLS